MIFVKPAFMVGRLFWRGGDIGIIDRFGPDGLSAPVVDVTKQAVKLQTGYVYHYMLIPCSPHSSSGGCTDRRHRAHHLVPSVRLACTDVRLRHPFGQ